MERSYSPKKCGGITVRGKKCKKLFGSCKFHVPPSIERRSEIEFLEKLPEVVIYQTLLKIDRERLHEICESASKMRIRNVLTKIETICQNERFQKEYSSIHPEKEYPVIFKGDISIGDSANYNYISSDLVNVIIDKKGVIELRFPDIRLRIWKKGDKWLSLPVHFKMNKPLKNRKKMETEIIGLTGRSNIFSKNSKDRNRAVESLLGQILSEVSEQYREGKIYAQYDDPVKNLIKLFGIIG